MRGIYCLFKLSSHSKRHEKHTKDVKSDFLCPKNVLLIISPTYMSFLLNIIIMQLERALTNKLTKQTSDDSRWIVNHISACMYLRYNLNFLDTSKLFFDLLGLRVHWTSNCSAIVTNIKFFGQERYIRLKMIFFSWYCFFKTIY